jgi:tRNA(Met) C34 N-acetyltransferase TmcA
LNQNQAAFYQAIINAIHEKRSTVFFLDGPGGTGKTHVYGLLLAKVRSQRRIALVVASSRIATLLLKGGRTTHSRFKIPIDLHEQSTCMIAPRTNLALLIQQVDLIIWDEAPRVHRHAFETMDRSLRDLM